MPIYYIILFVFTMVCNLSAETPSESAVTPSEILTQEPENISTPELPMNPEFDRFYGEFFKMLTMLGLIIGFLMVLTWFVKRILNTRLEQINSGSLIQVVERRMLTPKTSIYVLEIMGKRVVIAESHNGVTAINEFSSSPSFSKFNQLLEENEIKRETD